MGRSARADLTVRQIETITKIGYTADRKQPGLNLQVTAGASGYTRSWVFRYTSPSTGKRRELGLGPLRSIGLASARVLAANAESQIASGIDPKDARDAAKAQNAAASRRLTFEEAAAECIATQPHMECRSAAITVHVSRKLSCDLPTTGISEEQAIRSLKGRHAMKWQCSSKRQKPLWLSWGC